ncbi:hypothetical protein IP65_03165 [Novosphingobium sp. AAP1]|uniref:hypothetical protein n=1 Tax=Novosphingobium sp. AAP1 TaxID=1523413 RepID=UPI0006CE0754|nr:hypothetical protein [Novosphingobium sp. AAP1]KPF56750.1 hypothetical protein IP65_03165 [Novosphingobium sp. AAP1]
MVNCRAQAALAPADRGGCSMVCQFTVSRAGWVLAAASLMAAAASPAVARHQPPPSVTTPAASSAMVPYGPGPGPCSVPGIDGGEPQRHGWPPPCEAMPAPAYPGAGYYAPGHPPQAYSAPGYAGQVPVYTGSWIAPPGYYVAGVVMVPVPLPRTGSCQPCGETRTVTTTRTVDVAVRPARRVPPRHPPLHDKRVKEKRIKE